MKFTIEIYATANDGAETLLHRTTVSAITPLVRARMRITYLPHGRDAERRAARVLNPQAETVYKIGE